MELTALKSSTITPILEHLRTEAPPFSLRKKKGETPGDDDPQHRDAYDRSPDLYALAATAEGVTPAQQARALFELLRGSRDGFSSQTRAVLDRVTSFLLVRLPAETVLTVFLAVRRAKANHKHTTRAILRFLAEHPDLAGLARDRRPTLVDIIEHALGRDVARACAKGEDPKYVLTHLRAAGSKAVRLEKVLPWLYRHGPAPEGKERDENEHHSEIHLLYAEPARPEAPKTVTATNRGEISSALVHLYRGGTTKELKTAVTKAAELASRGLPRFEGALALVLDASASTRGYGEREYCTIAQSVALTLVLEQCVKELRVFAAGGRGEPPFPTPEGATDLAGTLLEALEGAPDLVAIVTDGYENRAAGDLALVLDALPRAGVATPVVLVNSKFSRADDLSLRRPAPGARELEVWHQDDFPSLLFELFALGGGDDFTRAALSSRLARLEKEAGSWLAR